jgi:C-terminal processing protease CtpA/Prc
MSVLAKRIISTWAIAFLLCSGSTIAGHSYTLDSRSQAIPDSEDKVQLERLVAIGKLWTTVKYFHPWLAYKDIDWDAAFLKAVNGIQTSKTKDDYRAVINRMLNTLGDSCTHLVSARPNSSAVNLVFPSVQMRDDGILLVTLGNAPDYNRLQKTVAEPIAQAAKAKKIVFDMRDNAMGMRVLRAATLTSKPLRAPGIRRRYYSGYPAPDGSGSGGYYSAFLVVDGTRSAGNPKALDKPVILLMNHRTYLSAELLGLQAMGLAAIVAEGGMAEESVVPQISVRLMDDLVATVRTGEIVYPDGTGGFVPNKMVSSGGLETALTLASTGGFSPPERKPLPAVGSLVPDKSYSESPYPSEAHRALAAFRIWSVYHYFHPYKHLMSDDWDALLPQFLTRMMNAENTLEYHKTVAEMVAHTQDTHCFVNSGVLSDFYGIAQPPLAVRWIENSVVVTRVVDDSSVKESGLIPGNISLKVDGRDVKDCMDELAPYIAASTPQALMWRIMNTLLNGKEGSNAVLVVKDAKGQIRNVSLPRMRHYAAELRRTIGDPIRLINDNLGYVDLSRLPPSRVDEMFEKFRNTRGFIMDMRGYPQGTAWQIAPRLTETDQPVAAQFRRNLVTADNISSYYFEQRLPHTDKWRYSGETVMLIDERAISQSEHSGLFYRTTNGTKFIGSATNGANGDVTFFWVPGGIRITYSGHDVRHADGTQLQRVGLQPDIDAKPTIAGIRSGRDEVLEKAIEYLSR